VGEHVRVRISRAAASVVGASLLIASATVPWPARGASAAPTLSSRVSSQYLIDAAHDGHQVDPLFKLPLTVAWSHDMGGEVWYPLIADGKVFVAACNHPDGDYCDDTISAFALDTGRRLWGPVLAGGESMAWDRGILFVSSEGFTEALDARTGRTIWYSDLIGTFVSPPTTFGGVLYVSAFDGSGYSTIDALNESTGAVLWRVPDPGVGTWSAPAVDRSGVYLTFLGGSIRQSWRITRQGTLAWETNPGASGGGGSSDVLHAGLEYIRDFLDPTQDAIVEERSGRVVGTYSFSTPPAVDGDVMFGRGANLALEARDAQTGALIWSNPFRHAARLATVPIVVNGCVVVADVAGIIHVVSEKTGRQLWFGRTGGTSIGWEETGRASGNPGLAEADGHLAFGNDRKIVVFAASP
jgi:outer membrane protein assembly factor BamB